MLTRFTKEYPLPAGWQTPKLFTEEFRLDALSLNTVGLVSQKGDGDMRVTAGAADADVLPIERAYFELLERIYLLEADEKFSTLPNYTEIFPKSTKPHEWVYARSNGVAAHKSFHLASQAACLELWERHAILDAWFSQSAPEQIAFNFPLLHLAGKHYLPLAFQFLPQNTNLGAVYTIGAFAFPKQRENPLVYGFGSGFSLEKALQKAENECLQRLAFLWGEKLQENLPEFSPTPMYHQDYFMTKKGLVSLNRWLEKKGNLQIQADERETYFIDLSPKELNKNFCLVKAYTPRAKPLIFGRYPNVAIELTIHPIA